MSARYLIPGRIREKDMNKAELNTENKEQVTEKKERVFTTKGIVMIGVFAAVTAVLAQVSIPMPWGIPITLQTFAVALTGYCLGKYKGTMSVLVYILLGVAGVPVFANLTGGIAKLAGATGGYIWGFLFMVFACGLEDTVKHKWISVLLGILGLAACHLLGVIQYAFLSQRTMAEAFLLASAPYLIKDVVSVAAAYGLAIPLRRAMQSVGGIAGNAVRS